MPSQPQKNYSRRPFAFACSSCAEIYNSQADNFDPNFIHDLHKYCRTEFFILNQNEDNGDYDVPVELLTLPDEIIQLFLQAHSALVDTDSNIDPENYQSNYSPEEHPHPAKLINYLKESEQDFYDHIPPTSFRYIEKWLSYSKAGKKVNKIMTKRERERRAAKAAATKKQKQQNRYTVTAIRLDPTGPDERSFKKGTFSYMKELRRWRPFGYPGTARDEVVLKNVYDRVEDKTFEIKEGDHDRTEADDSLSY